MGGLQLAQQYFDAWNQHDAGAIVGQFADGGTYCDPTTQGPLTGPAIGAYASGLWSAFPDLSFELISTAECVDNMVAAQWIMRGTNHGSMFDLPPTGRAIELPGSDFVVVGDDGIESVTGYFDSGVIPRQLGLQVLVQPHAVGPFSFGRSVAVQSGSTARPGAFSVTALSAGDAEQQERIAEYSRQTAAEMLGMQGFIGWTGVVVGDRMLTITAWESPEDSKQLMSGGAHGEAMNSFFADADKGGVASGGWTSVWSPARINAVWSRCASCGRMNSFERQDGMCDCGESLPAPGPWW